MPYTRATRKGTYGLIGLTGMSGSGKTHSALLLARGLVGPEGKIAGLDTENGRMSLFADVTPFDVQELWAPFPPERYIEKVEEAAQAGYQALIIDSGSHEWEGTGGVLEMADAAKSKGGKPLEGLAKWKGPKTAHKRFVNAILQTRMHIILCLRGRDKKVQVKDPKTGRQVIVSAGVQPIQEDRVLYEMTISLIMDEETQTPHIRKCPDEIKHLFPDGQRITVETGAALADWFGGALPVDEHRQKLFDLARSAANAGHPAFQAYWKTLNQQDRAALNPHMDEFRAAWTAADSQNAEQYGDEVPAENGADPTPAPPPAGDVLDEEPLPDEDPAPAPAEADMFDKGGNPLGPMDAG